MSKSRYFSFPQNHDLLPLASELRKSRNLSEVLLWKRLNKKQFLGLDFDRQTVIGNYIIDLFCYNKKVALEIDGASHRNKVDYDANRDSYLESLGITVIHIAVGDVFSDIEGVMRKLHSHPAFTKNE